MLSFLYCNIVSEGVSVSEVISCTIDAIGVSFESRCFKNNLKFESKSIQAKSNIACGMVLQMFSGIKLADGE